MRDRGCIGVAKVYVHGIKHKFIRSNGWAERYDGGCVTFDHHTATSDVNFMTEIFEIRMEYAVEPHGTNPVAFGRGE